LLAHAQDDAAEPIDTASAIGSALRSGEVVGFRAAHLHVRVAVTAHGEGSSKSADWRVPRAKLAKAAKLRGREP
jgi:hypothetical protein